jgi:hypothetical protein
LGHSSEVGVGRSFFGSAQGRKINILDDLSTAGIPGETGVVLSSVPGIAKRAKLGFLLAM